MCFLNRIQFVWSTWWCTRVTSKNQNIQKLAELKLLTIILILNGKPKSRFAKNMIFQKNNSSWTTSLRLFDQNCNLILTSLFKLFQTKQLLRFEVYVSIRKFSPIKYYLQDIDTGNTRDLASQDFLGNLLMTTAIVRVTTLGRCECHLADIVAAADGALRLKLRYICSRKVKISSVFSGMNRVKLVN